jgi:hypothetical protein
VTRGLGDLLEPAQRAGGLGEFSLALARRRLRRLVRFGHLTDERADAVEGRGDFMNCSRALRWRGPYIRNTAPREKPPRVAAEIANLETFNLDNTVNFEEIDSVELTPNSISKWGNDHA